KTRYHQIRGPGCNGDAVLRAQQTGHRACSRRSPCFSISDRTSESRARRGQRPQRRGKSPPAYGRSLRDVSAPVRAQQPERRHAEWGRAADARARARHDVGAAAALSGRAVAWPRADRGPGHLPEDQGHQCCRHQRAAGRAERALCLRDCEPRLCAADRLGDRKWSVRRTQAQPARAGGLSRPHRGERRVMTLSGKYSLAGKSAVVTGAGNGIGRAIALAFAEAGASVACVDLDKTAAEATAKATGKTAIAVACDVSSETQVEAAAKTILAKYPTVHILLNGAAGNDPNGSVLELTLEDWNKVFGVNVAGAFLMSRAILPAMVKAGGGSIIHIASQLGSVAGPRRAVYCASKGALIQLAKAMATDHA